MGIFSSNTLISESGLFKNYTDCHCHILPGVDDGFKTIEDSLSVLKMYECAGITGVWLTPHIMEDIPNTTRDLKQRFEELCGKYQGPVKLNLASENMLDSLFVKRLESNDILPLSGNRLLVETSYFNPPFEMDELLGRIQARGFYPVLAHPERYVYMDMKRYEELHDKGILFQLNIGSLYGSYGPKARNDSRRLLAKGYYSLSGTDLHSIAPFSHMQEVKLKDKILKLIPKE